MADKRQKNKDILSDKELLKKLDISLDVSDNFALDETEDNYVDFSELVESFEHDDWDDNFDNYIPIESSNKSLKNIDKLNRKRNKPNKIKIPMTKRKKRIVFLTVTPIFAVVFVLITFATMFLMVTGFGQKIDSTNLNIDLHNKYYVGTVGKINLQKIFPQGTEFKLTDADETVTLTNTTLQVGSLKDFKITYKDTEAAGKTVTMDVNVVRNGVNVDTYDALYKNAHTTDENIEKGEFNSPVIIQNKELKMKLRYANNEKKRQATIKLTNSLYGNGCTLNANSVAYGFGTDWKNSGYTAIEISQHSAIVNVPILIRDLHLIGKEAESSDTLKTYTNYGALLNIEGGTKENNDVEKKAKANIENCIIERGHKVVHMRNAIVNMSGTIVRTAADTTVSIATTANCATTLNIKNCVIADSLTAGILMYCIDGSITEANDNMNTWNQINIQGFLDIYNWKKSSEIALLPDTEGGPQIANFANGIVRSEVDNPKKNQEYKVVQQGNQYVHFGIIQICTVSNGINLNKSIITNYDSQGFKAEQFPIPDAAKAIIRDVKVCGYMNNANGNVAPQAKIGDKIDTLYDELYYGRV